MTFKRTVIIGYLGMALAAGLTGCGSMSPKTFATAEDQFRQARKDYDKKHYLRSIDGFQKVIYNYSGSPMVDSAQYFLAMSHYEMRDYFMAATEFERLVNNYPGSPFVDDGQYMTGLCYYKAAPGNHGLDQKDLLLAVQTLQDFLIDHPESDAADDARATIKAARQRMAEKDYDSGRTYYRLGYYESAGIYFQNVIDEYTDTEWAARALFTQGEIARKQKNYQTAKDKFTTFLVVYPDHKLAGKARNALAWIEKHGADAGEKK
jgi:outer membrane protein assembly factor BamD